MKAIILIASCLVYGSYGMQGTIKSKLGSMKNLAEVEQITDMPALSFADLNCPCGNLTASTGLPAPGGAAQTQVYQNGALVSQGTTVQQIPNTAQITNCNGQCCSCGAAEEASISTATKIRHFNISGAIEVTESVNYQEQMTAEEQSIGESQKACTQSTTNSNGGSGSAPGGGCVSVCLNNTDSTL